jgi:hypothetical protein
MHRVYAVDLPVSIYHIPNMLSLVVGETTLPYNGEQFCAEKSALQFQIPLLFMLVIYIICKIWWLENQDIAAA